MRIAKGCMSLALIGISASCDIPTSASGSLPDTLKGLSEYALIESLGVQPSSVNSYPSLICGGEMRGGLLPIRDPENLCFSAPFGAELLWRESWEAGGIERLKELGPVKTMTFELGELDQWIAPTTVRTTVYGNNLYSTINSGGARERDTRCNIWVVIANGAVFDYAATGEGCGQLTT
jgi:hypothetical protein